MLFAILLTEVALAYQGGEVFTAMKPAWKVSMDTSALPPVSVIMELHVTQCLVGVSAQPVGEDLIAIKLAMRALTALVVATPASAPALEVVTM